jgi:hypothetical protein
MAIPPSVYGDKSYINGHDSGELTPQDLAPNVQYDQPYADAAQRIQHRLATQSYPMKPASQTTMHPTRTVTSTFHSGSQDKHK